LLGLAGWVTFWAFFAVFVFLGFYGARWRRGNLNLLHEWALAGRRLGIALAWFLIGADLYTAYTFVAVPSLVFAKGAYAFFAVPYVSVTFAIAMLLMTNLWDRSRERGYITAADFVQDQFNSVTLALLVALTGIVAELPYIALQIDGMRAVLEVMMAGMSSATTVSEVALVVAFTILAAFTYTSGLRGSALGAVFKDALVWLGVISLIVIVPLSINGGFSTAFSIAAQHKLPTGVETLKPVFLAAYESTFIGSALALYLYPHSVNGSLSAESRKALRYSTALLPLYGIGLALLPLLGILVYGSPSTLKLLSEFPASERGLLAIPALAATSLPAWFAGLVLLGIFVGGMVPAAIMAIAQANLLIRNVIKPFYRLSERGETRAAQWASVAFKFLALGFVFVTPLTYALQLQLTGGIIILQTLPPVFLGLLTRKMEKYSLMAGWAAGMLSGILLLLYANMVKGHLGPIVSTLYPLFEHPFFIGMIALAINLAVVGLDTGIAYALGWRPK
jgi:SSS family solute:Na+ symporter